MAGVQAVAALMVLIVAGAASVTARSSSRAGASWSLLDGDGLQLRQLKQTCTTATCASTITLVFKGSCSKFTSATTTAVLSGLQRDVAADLNTIINCTSNTVTATAVGTCQAQGTTSTFKASVAVTATPTCVNRVQNRFQSFCTSLSSKSKATLCSTTLKNTCSALSAKGFTLQSASGTIPAPVSNGSCPVQQQIAVPSYIYPLANDGSRDPYWQTLYNTQAAKLVLINPNSGPGTTKDSAYASLTSDFRAIGRVVLGYVYTGYGTRDANAVIADINAYYGWYNISGIFFDEGDNTCATVAYYQNLVAAVKAKDPNAVAVLNWGIDGPECFLNATSNTVDIVVNFEDTYNNYLAWSGPAAYVTKYTATKFWHLVHTTPATETSFTTAVNRAKAKHAAWVYITDDVLPNPWDSVPGATLWNREVTEVTSNATCVA